MLKTEFQRLALDIIGSSDRPLPAFKIINALGTPNTTGRRYLNQMTEAKMLVRDKDGCYAIAIPENPPMKKWDDAYCLRYRVMMGKTVSICANALAHLDPIKDMTVKGYCLDLYFPEQKLAVEAIPLGLDDDPFNREFDLQRTRFITRILGCQWLWFDPSEEGFCPGKVINQIIKVANAAIACEVV